MTTISLLLTLSLLPLALSFDCYNQLCHGIGTSNVTVPCDQSARNCTHLPDGTPQCLATPYPGQDQEGINCTTTSFTCQADDRGNAVCVPTRSCYDNMCQGTGENSTVFINCNQGSNTCSVNETGYPICTPGGSGQGVDCEVSEEQDEFYCSNNSTTGAALCVYPPRHSCYHQKCVRAGYNGTAVECDQSSSRCVWGDDGVPSCVGETRGDGVDCSGVLNVDFHCGVEEETGAGLCLVTPPSDCYDTKCVGTGDNNATLIDCDQSKNLCQVIEETGAPICTPLGRGAGVNCTVSEEQDQYYCSSDAANGKGACIYPAQHDCYNTLCKSNNELNPADLPCDQSVNRCDHDELGNPICINTTRGDGVDCEHSSPLDFFCQADATGDAICEYTPVKNCYNQFCQGSGVMNASWISCDGAESRCDLDVNGSPICVNNSRGVGVDCIGDEKYYCSHSADDPFTATCSYSKLYSCYDTKCRGIFDNSNVTVDCSQDMGYCLIDPNGLPRCVLDSTMRGNGIMCTGTFTCGSDKLGAAYCKSLKHLVGVWVVVGVALAVVVVVVTVFVVKRRARIQRTDDKQYLLSPSGY